jgi:hypothetical protein
MLAADGLVVAHWNLLAGLALVKLHHNPELAGEGTGWMGKVRSSRGEVSTRW